LRIWDLLGEAAFGNLQNKHVLKIRGASGQVRVGATACCYCPDGSKAIGGAADGTIHIWNSRKGGYSYTKADFILALPLTSGKIITGLAVSGDSQILAARYDGGFVVLWQLKLNSLKAKGGATPLRVFSELFNEYPTANVTFSPDGALICCGTSSTSAGGGSDSKPRLFFFEVSPDEVASSEPLFAISAAAMHIAVIFSPSADPSIDSSAATSTSSSSSVIYVRWQSSTNQILCGLSSGAVRVFFDPRCSKKGALLSSLKMPKREMDASDFTSGIGEIMNPLALPLYRNVVDKPKERSIILKDPVRAKIPEKPSSQGPGKRANNSFFFTNYVMSARGENGGAAAAEIARTEDPRSALLKMEEAAKSDPIFLGRAYETSQPKKLMHNITFEAEQEE
jgi:hypothetical protein